MKVYIESGVAEKVPDNQISHPNSYYLPHCGVIKESSTSTKLVFDGSAKPTGGLSLNDNLLIGPTIQDDLFSLLIRFRTYKYVMTADITKMNDMPMT